MIIAITSSILKNKKKKQGQKQGFATKYDAFCKGQEGQSMLWYLVPLMSMPAAIMPISIFIMSYFPGFIPFVGVSMLLFFSNIILTISEQSTKTRITFFLLTVAFHIAVPLLSFVFLSLPK